MGTQGIVADQASDELVCHCAVVSRKDIEAAIAAAPSSTFGSLSNQLGCGVQCGCCKPLLLEMLGQSPWFDVVEASRRVLTDGHDHERRIVQIDLRLSDEARYPQVAPAQHVVFQAKLDGAWVTRTYTVIRQSEDGRMLSIAMRRIPNGQFSSALLDADDDAFAALPLRIAAPSGATDLGDDRPIVCFIGGVGITLALSLLHGLRPGERLHVDYSASRRGDMVYTDELEAAAAAGEEFSCNFRTDDRDGFIDDAHILQTTKRFPNARYYVCGPEGYTRNVRNGLRHARIDDADVRIEAFFLRSGSAVVQRRSLRRSAYLTGAALALLPLALLAPALARYVPNYDHNPGHEEIECVECHTRAPGSTRQQLQAKARLLLGLRDDDSAFGMSPVRNNVCIACHENPDDRHPAHRFLEPRFAEAREALAPHECVSCHREHVGTRLSRVDTGFCESCHQDLAVKDDPTRPTHEALIREGRWNTCLTCHDFHGNHAHQPPQDLRRALTPEALSAYLAKGGSP
ncbi:MAG: hypothetical protein E6Q88_11600 [Lysobacteraceae bacterium]|nr:MAG: hypothetical protein E6Q88_11600 [Xanthomonadaceae bacterium]